MDKSIFFIFIRYIACIGYFLCKFSMIRKIEIKNFVIIFESMLLFFISYLICELCKS